MQPLVTCILPVRGRQEQTIQVAAQLRATAGDVAATWVAVGGIDEQATVEQLGAEGWYPLLGAKPRLTYWQALRRAMTASNEPYFCALANDLNPVPNWLANGMAAYRARFPDDLDGLMGFAGDGHGPQHSCHFIISRGLLTQFGGWPTHYDHNFGDAELCERAQALGRYGKATRAILRHMHPGLGQGQTDTVYHEGRARWAQDEALYRERRRMWVNV